MNFRIFAFTLYLTIAQFAFSQEEAQLEASILPGELAIDPTSLAGTITPMTGSGVSTGAEQPDAVVFDIRGIVVNDFNGDGRGFRLTATPQNLVRIGFQGGGANATRRNTLTIGTITGFHDVTNPATTVIADPNTVIHLSSHGGTLEIDYEIAYTIPRLAREGVYEGEVAFSVIAD